MSNKPLIICDFDGTLADSTDLLIRCFNNVAIDNGYKEVFSKEAFSKHSVESLLKQAGVRFWSVPSFVKKCQEAFYQRTKNVSLHPGIIDVLKTVSAHARLAIVSGNTTENIHAILKQNGVDDLFIDVRHSSFFAKNRVIKQIRKQEVVDKIRTLYVGDETRDVHAARRAGVECVAVTWGLQSEPALLKTRPRMLASSAHELEHLLSAWIIQAQ